MKQLIVPKEIQICIDFADPELPVSVGLLRPVLFQEGNSFCCLLGPDTTQGVVGCGYSPEEAMAEWDVVLQERINGNQENDFILQYIKEVNNQSLSQTS